MAQLRSSLIPIAVLCMLSCGIVEGTTAKSINQLRGVSRVEVEVSIGAFPSPSNELLSKDQWLFERSKARIDSFKDHLRRALFVTLSDYQIEIESGAQDRILVEVWGHSSPDDVLKNRINVFLIEVTVIKHSEFNESCEQAGCDCTDFESRRAIGYASDSELEERIISQTSQLLESRWLVVRSTSVGDD